MPLTRKGSEILSAMRGKYGDKKGTSVSYASANKGTITGVHQTHHKPVTDSPFHGLRPPKPEGANADPRYDYIPAGRREVTNTPAAHPEMKGKAGNEAAHKKLAHEVAGGLRSFSFARVRQDLQAPPQRG